MDWTDTGQGEVQIIADCSPTPLKSPHGPAAPPTLNTPFVHHRETTPIRAFLLSLVVQRVHPMERTLSHPTILTAKAQEDT